MILSHCARTDSPCFIFSPHLTRIFCVARLPSTVIDTLKTDDDQSAMEDAHATILDLDKTDESAEAQCGKGKKGKNSFFAVYDGHGGERERGCSFILLRRLLDSLWQ